MKIRICVVMLFQVVCSAYSASVDWAITDVRCKDIYSNVYLFPWIPGTYSSEVELANASSRSFGIPDEYFAWTQGTISRLDTDYTMQAKADGITKDIDYYIAIVPYSDRDTYLYGRAEGLAEMVYDTEAGETSPGTYEFSMMSFDKSTVRRFSQQTESSPEPSAALLLLVGGAGLLLRRIRVST